MTLFWSIRPFERVMSVERASPGQREVLSHGRITMEVTSLGDRVRIERLISPNPRDYLNPLWQPGTVLRRSQLKI